MAILNSVNISVVRTVCVSKGGCGGGGGGLVGGSRPDEVGLHTSLAFSFYSNNRTVRWNLTCCGCDSVQ